MQYHFSQTVSKTENIEFVAIRHHWGKENEIFEKIENAFVFVMLDHLLLVPIDVPRKYIPATPNIVMDGKLYAFDESCDFCKNRLEKVTSGCDVCVFSPLRESGSFNFNKENLKMYFEEQEAAKINILDLMAKKDIYQLFYLYHFKNFYDKEMPLTKGEFIQFISQFDVEILHQDDKEIILKKGSFFYETEFQKNYVEYHLNKTDLEGLKKVYASINEKLRALTEREKLLKRIIGESI